MGWARRSTRPNRTGDELPDQTVPSPERRRRRGHASGVGVALLYGGSVGLAWGLALRSWMTHLAIQFSDWPRFTWKGTFLAVLLPAAVVGAVIGWDWGTRLHLGKRHRWVIWSPLLLVVGPALVAESFVGTLMDTGEGSGAIGVVIVGLSGGYALSRRGNLWARLGLGLVGLSVVGTMTYVFYVSEPPLTSSDAFGALYLVVLMAWLAVGCSIPLRPMPGSRTRDEAAQTQPTSTLSP